MDGAQTATSRDTLVDQVRDAIAERHLEVIISGASDLNGIFRGKRIPAKRFAEHPYAPVLLSDYFWAMDTEENVMPPEPGYQGWFPSWSQGFEDVAPIPDLTTFRIVPWLEGTGLVLNEHCFRDGRPLEIAPRFVLQRLWDRALGLDVVPKMAAELEFFLFRETEESLEEKGYRCSSLEPLNRRLGAYGVYRATTDEHIIRPLARHLEDFGIPVEYWNPEGGAGQYEVNLVYGDLMEAADRAFLFKHAVKEIASQHGLMATFMAKTLPGFGSSCHVHASFWSPEGRNLMWDGAAPDHLSQTARHVIGGQIAALRELTLLFAPTINSYKRFLVDSAAGTTATWGYENRTCGLRIMNDGEQTCRIENRVPGGDVNPYLAMAGCTLSALYGLENRIEPPSPVEGNAYYDPNSPRIPMSLEEAITAFESSEIAREYLGEEFVRFFAVTRRYELMQFQANITDWEVKRYFQFV